MRSTHFLRRYLLLLRLFVFSLFSPPVSRFVSVVRSDNSLNPPPPRKRLSAFFFSVTETHAPFAPRNRQILRFLAAGFFSERSRKIAAGRTIFFVRRLSQSLLLSSDFSLKFIIEQLTTPDSHYSYECPTKRLVTNARHRHKSYYHQKKKKKINKRHRGY